ncbi:primosomal protein N' [Lancefieldella parvula DSM 20469]|uniref:Replication restart protein PriA n=1 Tax=Lancefieldella parvula (strain ATCC 33793 / DSM 20469 / CCUG 32760 / JCM 10300 / KCTC 3663 / VPI 0546 / 1246) TaxID=521095 RepID=C8W758_LANP1|nr:primosomal protein N' [Lancefieldella parvula]ACV51298.1 primosomal protein N' [Lancefieldella parvula DSM 20469]
MPFAHVVLDIPTRALSGTFDYAIPSSLEETAVVGTTVLVPFSHRQVVGYIVGVSDSVSSGLDVSRVLPITQVLAGSAFDEQSAQAAEWMSKEYACSYADALHPFLAPGQKVKVTRKDAESPWQLVCEKSGPVDERWVELTEKATNFTPAANASKQRSVLEALAQGAMRLSELSATIPGARSAVTALQKKGIVEVRTQRQIRGSQEGLGTTLSSGVAPRPQQLTEGQKSALAAIEAAQTAAQGDVVLIDGVTGSGKTEVYLSAIEKTLAAGKGAVVLVPEISLTAQTVGRFRSRFGEQVAVLHSKLSLGERFDQWDLIRQGKARVVVGARSALFAPIKNPGLYIIDEEHEASYKQDSLPRYHAREVAAQMARLRGAALVLGSATPSLESLYRTAQGSWRGTNWTRVAMTERPGVAVLPQVQVVDMASQFKNGGRSVFSAALALALQEITERGEKSVLLLNRRGFANFLMCRECGCVPECPHCSTSLTYHERTHSLVCHSCGRQWSQRAYPNPSSKCPNCGSRYMGAYGVGTQRVEDELKLLLGGDAPIIRMDADTTAKKGEHQRLLELFDATPGAVLIGTQMIAKGLDFPDVTLVGVINADTMLKLPDFRAAERTFDLLEQVAGRAGRGEKPGKVIIQSYWSTHPAIASVVTHDRRPFLDAELKERREGAYPPFSRLSNVLFWGASEKEVRRVADQMADALHAKLDAQSGWEILGPADCVKAKVKDKYRRHILVKSPIDAQVGEILSQCAASLDKRVGINMTLDVDAYDMM